MNLALASLASVGLQLGCACAEAQAKKEKQPEKQQSIEEMAGNLSSLAVPVSGW